MIASLHVLLALIAAPSPAALALPQNAIVDQIQTTVTAVRGTNDSAVYTDGQGLQETLGSATTRYKASLHNVQRSHPFGRPADITDLIRDAKDRLTYGPHLPPANVREMVEHAAALYGAGRVHLDESLTKDDMGLYSYKKPHVADGIIKLNEALRGMGTIVDPDFLMATLIHEAGHQGDPNLGAEGTLDGEIVAFLAEYRWTAYTDPTGERLAQLRLDLAQELKEAPSPLVVQAINYTATLDRLRGTGGDRQKIKRFAMEIGYSDKPGGEGPEHPPTGL